MYSWIIYLFYNNCKNVAVFLGYKKYKLVILFCVCVYARVCVCVKNISLLLIERNIT